jgi:asparagine synthase (glutamine-hydrolysing)
VDLSAATPAQELEARATTMAAALAHRGPDASGAWADPDAGVALGHRRLSIIDLSPAGAQPMHSDDGRWVLAYNGEIYNFSALRQELEQAGEGDWRGASDTEVLLRACARWGVRQTLLRCAGMFALALWDRRERELWLARDRVGEKPLYYGIVGNHLLFGSELKALAAHPAWTGNPPGVDSQALAAYFQRGFVPAPQSIHQGVRKLPPGCLLHWRAHMGASLPGPEAWWSMREAAERGARQPFAGAEQEAHDELERLLLRAVAGQMVADVPLGAFLSGGIDSSLVVALMQRQSARPVRTFTIGFDDPEVDEAAHARAVAAHLGTDHTELPATAAHALEVAPLLPAMYDEPLGDYSQIPTYLVARMTREHVTVSLSGDGGDEFFAGYNTYLWVRHIWERVGGLPAPARKAFALLKWAPPRLWDLLAPGRRLGHRAHLLADLAGAASPEALFLALTRHWPAPHRLVRGARPGASEDAAAVFQDLALPDMLTRLQYHDSVRYLPDDVLAKVDRATMAVSLESRAPLLDHRVVEFAWSLPPAWRVRGAGRAAAGKQPLRAVLHRHVPPEMVERPKRGFTVPMAAWLRGPLRDWAEALLDRTRLRDQGHLDPDLVRARWREHLAGHRDWKFLLWDVLAFQAWLEGRGRNRG